MRAEPGPAATRTAPSAARWERWNFRLLAVFAPVLILTGVTGFLIPPRLALMSGAAPYNTFHIVCGALGVGLVLMRRRRPIAAFNLGFGAVDLYQAAAGLAGVFPASLFALRPADHVVHVVLGVLLCAVGARGLSSNPQETTT